MALETNWRGTTGLFVCEKSGDDFTGDGSQANPYATVGQHTGDGTNRTFNLRTGYYPEVLGIPNGSNEQITLICDGVVVIDGTSSTSPFYFGSTAQNDRLAINGAILQNINGMKHSSNGVNGTRTVFLENCTLKTSQDIGLNFQPFRTLFEDINTLFYTAGSIRCTFIRCDFSTRSSHKNSFFSKDSSIVDFILNTTFDECCFEDDGVSGFTLEGTKITDITLDGDANPIGIQYSDTQNFSGTVTIGGQVITFLDCFYTADPKFNDRVNSDYTLQDNTSPLFNLGNYMGAYAIANKFDLTHPAFNIANSGVSFTNLTNDGTKLTITSGTQGSFTTTNDPTQTFTLTDTITLTDPLLWFGQFIFNGNWIDDENFDPITNREVRLTYGIQFYDENEPNGVNSVLNWSPTYTMETFQKVELDGSSRGNGNVDADMQNLTSVTFRRFRLVDVTLRNDGV